MQKGLQSSSSSVQFRVRPGKHKFLKLFGACQSIFPRTNHHSWGFSHGGRDLVTTFGDLVIIFRNSVNIFGIEHFSKNVAHYGPRGNSMILKFQHFWWDGVQTRPVLWTNGSIPGANRDRPPDKPAILCLIAQSVRHFVWFVPGTGGFIPGTSVPREASEKCLCVLFSCSFLAFLNDFVRKFRILEESQRGPEFHGHRVIKSLRKWGY